jgi:hypothetical protein
MIKRSGGVDLLPANAIQKARPHQGEPGPRRDEHEVRRGPPDAAVVRSAVFRVLTKNNPAYPSAED